MCILYAYGLLNVVILPVTVMLIQMQSSIKIKFLRYYILEYLSAYSPVFIWFFNFHLTSIIC